MGVEFPKRTDVQSCPETYDTFGSGRSPSTVNYEDESSGRLVRTSVTGSRAFLDVRVESDLMSYIIKRDAQSGSGMSVKVFAEGDSFYGTSQAFSLLGQWQVGGLLDTNRIMFGGRSRNWGKPFVRVSGGIEYMKRKDPSLNLNIGVVRVPRSSLTLGMVDPTNDDMWLRGWSVTASNTQSRLAGGNYGSRFLNANGSLDSVSYNNTFLRGEVLFGTRDGKAVFTLFGEGRIPRSWENKKGVDPERLPAFGTHSLRGGFSCAVGGFEGTLEEHYSEKLSPDDKYGDHRDWAATVEWGTNVYTSADGKKSVDVKVGGAITDYRTCKARGLDFGFLSGFLAFVIKLPHWVINAAIKWYRAPKMTKNPGVDANSSYQAVSSVVEWQKITTQPGAGQNQIVAYIDIPFSEYWANYHGTPTFSIKSRDASGAIIEQEVTPGHWVKMDAASLGLSGKLVVGGVSLIDEKHGNATYSLSGQMPVDGEEHVMTSPEKFVDAVHNDTQLGGHLRLYLLMDTNGVPPKAVPPKSPSSGYRLNSFITVELRP